MEYRKSHFMESPAQSILTWTEDDSATPHFVSNEWITRYVTFKRLDCILFL